MNSYYIAISSSWALLILLLIIAFAITFWVYRTTVPPISTRRKAVLMGLRFIALTILLFAVFEPILSLVNNYLLKPKVAVFADNSMSTLMLEDSLQRKAKYSELFEASNIEDFDNEQIEFYSFDSEMKKFEEFSFDSLHFKGQMTNLSQNFESMENREFDDNLQAAVIFTDGIYNSGDNPLYAIEELALPVYVVGIGDTIQKKDISIESIISNDIAYVDKMIPVNVNIAVSGLPDLNKTIKLFNGKELISEQEFLIREDQSNYSFNFNFTPKKEGMINLKAVIDAEEDESNKKNNSKSTFIKVLRNKKHIVLFASAPSSDVSFFKKNFENEKGTEITSYIQKKGAEFYDIPQPNIIADADLIVFIGFPNAQTPDNVLQMISNNLKTKSLFFMPSLRTDYNKLKVFNNYMPFTTRNSAQREFQVMIDVKEASVSSSILRVNGTKEDLDHWNKLAPVFKTETFVKAKADADILATIRVNEVKMDEPFVLSTDKNGRKTLCVMGYGLYRWKLLSYALDQENGEELTIDLYKKFIDNSTKWLTVDNKNKQIEVKVSKKYYKQGEKVDITAQVYDQKYEVIDNANISLNLYSENEKRELVMTSFGNGRYRSQIEGLPDGEYAFSADVKVNSRKLGSDDGKFSIGDIKIEFQSGKMNYHLLQEIAKRSGGNYYDKSNIVNLTNDIKAHKYFRDKSQIEKNQIQIWNLAWLLAISLICFALEWFLRKRSGMI